MDLDWNINKDRYMDMDWSMIEDRNLDLDCNKNTLVKTSQNPKKV